MSVISILVVVPLMVIGIIKYADKIAGFSYPGPADLKKSKSDVHQFHRLVIVRMKILKYLLIVSMILCLYVLFLSSIFIIKSLAVIVLSICVIASAILTNWRQFRG